ncbi:MAG: hypothetical protein AB1921_02340 [Thermodesulfobacteriota bacterium]
MHFVRSAAVLILISVCCFLFPGCGPEGWSTGTPTSTGTNSANTGGASDIEAADGPGIGQSMYYSSYASDDTSPIKLAAGNYTVTLDHFGTSAASLSYYDMLSSSNTGILISNHSGSIRASVDVTFAESTYYFHVDANGDWTISVTRNS